jgi:hypothetical protein
MNKITVYTLINLLQTLIFYSIFSLQGKRLPFKMVQNLCQKINKDFLKRKGKYGKNNTN